VRRLGPDLTREDPSPGELWVRAHSLLDAETPVVDLLLDQRVASGIGNVYKSEVLFLAGCSPLRCLADLGREDLSALYAIASHWLRRNLGGGPRIIRQEEDGRGPLWVYGRAGLPCLRCGRGIRRQQLGRNPRSTYWCPACQGGPVHRESIAVE
jgi:endonuclease VIII